MDIKRSILLVALAVVAYLMVLQWNQDYGQAALPTETAQGQPAAPALPDSPSATTEGNANDVPAVAGQQQASALPTGRGVEDCLELAGSQQTLFPAEAPTHYLFRYQTVRRLRPLARRRDRT